MARNEDRARQRRAKRGGENPEADEVAESVTPAPTGDEVAQPDVDAITADDEVEVDALTETQRAEIATRAGVAGAPIDMAPPTDMTPLTDFDPPAGGVTVGGEVTTGGGPRVIRFFKASWAELKRVRWPDRQQVAQGTAVTLGFVVVAGAFLGLADLVARQIVNLIL